MEFDRGSELEARLARAILLERKERLQLEAVLACLHQGTHDVRVALDLSDVCDTLFGYVLVCRLAQQICSDGGRCGVLLLLSGLGIAARGCWLCRWLVLVQVGIQG